MLIWILEFNEAPSIFRGDFESAKKEEETPRYLTEKAKTTLTHCGLRD
jgi:hypothetical protein